MKLRIREQSVRFRLSPEDVASLGRGESVLVSLNLGAEQTFTYGLEMSGTSLLGVKSVRSGVVIQCPVEMLRKLAETDEVGFERVIDLGGEGSVTVLVEKDFKCLVPRGEDDGNTFPNPNATS